MLCLHNLLLYNDPSSAVLLSHQIVMEMNNKIVAETENLRDQTEKLSKEIKYWTWTELLLALKQSQDLLPEPPSPVMLLDKLFDSLIERIASSCETSSSPSISSPNTSEFSLSCDTRSSISLSWWFEDLVALNTNVIEMLVKLMVSRNSDNGIISKFLFHYRKSRLAASPASPDDKVKIIEAVIEMLYSLDIRCVSHKSLFELLRVANVSRCRTSKLESMIGSLLDQANTDHLLIPSPPRKSYMYDVNMVLSFLKSFLGKGVFCVPLSRMKKVGILMDLYLAEIAPDPHLKPLKFSAVIEALPESSRDSFDGVYRAVNLYLEVIKLKILVTLLSNLFDSIRLISSRGMRAGAFGFVRRREDESVRWGEV